MKTTTISKVDVILKDGKLEYIIPENMHYKGFLKWKLRNIKLINEFKNL